MGDVLINDVPDEALLALDSRARRLGIPTSEYLCRLLCQPATRDETALTAAQLQRLSHVVRDLSDPEAMDQARSRSADFGHQVEGSVTLLLVDGPAMLGDVPEGV